MIENIKLRNFQSHKETKIDFSPGVNIIVGTSDSGKTVLIRALKWVVKNRPSGDAYRSNWGGDTEVEVQTKEGVIIRRRTKTKNEYELNREVLKALKTEVPEEVNKFLNIDGINLQFQFDASFLLSNTSGEVAEHFNRIANLEKIGISIQKIKSDLLAGGRSLQSKKERLGELREDLKGYSYLKNYEEDVIGVEGKIKRFKQGKLDLDALYMGIEKMQDIRLNIAENNKLLVFEISVNVLEEKIEKQKKERQKELELDRFIQDLESIELWKQKLNKLLMLSGKLESIEKNIVKKNKKVLEARDLKSILQRIHLSNKLIKEKKVFFELKSKDYTAKFPDVCPLCGGEIDRSNLLSK